MSAGGLREWFLDQLVTQECREYSAVPLDGVLIGQACDAIRERGWEPVEGARVSWNKFGWDHATDEWCWHARVSVFAAPVSGSGT